MSAADSSAFRQALADIDAGNSQEAEPALRRLVDRYPSNDKVNEALGLIYVEGGETSRALPFLQRACSDAPVSAMNHANLGAAWLKLGRAREAADELKIAVRLAPRNESAFSELGQAYMLLHKPAPAARAFGEAAAIKPRNADLLYNWAVALTDSGQPRQALGVLNRITPAEMSDESDALAGDIEEKLGNYLLAAQHYRNAAEKNPSEANLYTLSVEYLRHWTWEDAKRTAAWGLAKYPDSLQLKLASGVALFGSRDFPSAARTFADLLRQNPDNSMYAEMLGRSCNEFASGGRDCESLQGIANSHPENAAAAFYAAQQILNRPHSASDLDQAEQMLRHATGINPAMADAWYELGMVKAERQQWDESAAMLEKATSLRPSFASAHYQLAIADQHLDRPEDRRKQLALFQTYIRTEKDEVNARLRAMTIFLTKPH